MSKKEFKPCNVYHPSGIVKFADNEDNYNAYKKRGYLDTPQTEKEQPKTEKDAKNKKKN
tara:strand:+ start:1504 stop:1680 length:177 start_codon:yes stop_codon:yes gene_type:complete